MGFLLEASKHYRYQSSEIDGIIGLTILGLILLSLFTFLIWDYVKNGPNVSSLPHPMVDYSYPGWKHLAEQPGEVGEKIRSIRCEYYGINDTYKKINDNDEPNNNETKI